MAAYTNNLGTTECIETNTNEEGIIPPHLFEKGRAGDGDNPFLVILETTPEYDEEGGIPHVLEVTLKYGEEVPLFIGLKWVGGWVILGGVPLLR
jgi:hypothetical protein